MPTRNVVLTERQEELIETLVKSGRYQNASEVLRDGLRLVEQREAVDAVKLKALRAAARVGVGASDRDEKIQHFRGAASLFEMRFRRRSSQEQPNRGPLWSSGNGTSGSAPPQNSTLRISSNGPVRILVRDNRVSTATPSLRRSANWPRVPMSRALRLETRSHRVIGRSTLRGRVAVHAKS